MKAKLTVLLFLVTFFFLSSSGTAWADFSTTQLTSNTFDDANARINDAGQVVWQGWDGNDWEIYLYSGGVTSRLTNNGGNDIKPQINSAGQVVWADEAGGGIVLYSGGSINPITTNSYCASNDPQLNDSGQVVWSGGEFVWVDNGPPNGLVQQCTEDSEVFLYSGGSITKLTENYFVNDVSPRINASGKVVWASISFLTYNDEYLIYQYSGGITAEITCCAYNNFQLNNAGQIALMAVDGEIYFYDGSGLHLLTDYGDNYWYSSIQINDAGLVAWAAYDYNTGETFVFANENGVTTQLADIGNQIWDPALQVDDTGRIYWKSIIGSDYEVFSYSGGAVSQLTDDGLNEMALQTNNTREMVWISFDGTDNEIYLGSNVLCENPQLSVSRPRPYWASLADYLARRLSVDYTITNSGMAAAYDVTIVGTVDTAGASSVAPLPVVGNISFGASSDTTIRYDIPAGVFAFRTLVYASASNACGASISFPGPWPGA